MPDPLLFPVPDALQTDRLLLRPMSVADAAQLHEALLALGGLGAQRVELVTDEENAGSRAVALRCGFQLEGALRHTSRSPDGRLRNTCLYARLPGTG